MTGVRVKICGIRSAEDADAAVAAGTDFIGLNFFAPAKRSIPVDQAAAVLASVPDNVTRTALMVDPEDALVDQISAELFDLIQLHGTEPPDRVAEIKARTGLPAMKVIGVRDPSDVASIDQYASVADRFLIDAKAPKDSIIPGGHGIPFDWSLLAGRAWTRPWMLAGGLTSENVAEAIRLTGAPEVDVASGVETSPGVKDHAKMRTFVDAAKSRSEQ